MNTPTEDVGKVNLNRVHFPVRSLGFGKRVAVWFQGCSIGCPGCVSRDTWNPNQGSADWQELRAVLIPWSSEADGLTVSGGEPFEQPQALKQLLSWWKSVNSGDVLVYSGYPWEMLEERYRDIIALIDVLITDPFESKEPQTQPLRGSDNQRMHLLTSLSEVRYGQLDSENRIDVCISEGTVWLAGIPRQWDMIRLRRELAKLGVRVQTSDQMPLRVRA